MDLSQENLHVFAVRLGQFGAAALSVLYGESSGLFCLFNQASFKVTDVGLRQVLILADEENDMVPKVLFQMAFQSIPDGLRFADINGILSALGIASGQEIDARVLCLVTPDNALEFAPWAGDSLSGLV